VPPAAPQPLAHGSALNHHVHLHVCATEGVFVPAADGAGCDASPAFLPARPINQADLAALTERVHRRVIRWFRMQRLLDAAAAADMLAWENSGFSVDASVRIMLIDRDVPSYFRSLEHLLRSSARPPFALERLSVSRGADGQIARIRYVLPRHKVANWVGPSRSRKSTRPGPMALSTSRLLSFSTGSPARGPPIDWGELVQVHDDRAIFQASPDELPVIDIHSL
jgi:hypothetical protein